MAAPAAVIAAKVAIQLLQDKRVRTALLSLVVGIIGGLLLIIFFMFSLISNEQQSNQQALSYIFNTRPVDISAWDIPADYADELVTAKGRVQAAQAAVDAINDTITGDKINTLKAGVIYLCLFPNGEIIDKP